MVLSVNTKSSQIVARNISFLLVILLLSCNAKDSKHLTGVRGADYGENNSDRQSNEIFFSASDNELFKKTFPRKFEQVPSVAVSADGQTAFVAYYSGGESAGPGNFVTLSVSTDGGDSWKNDELVVFSRSPSVRVFDPGLWRDKDDHIHLFYATAKDSLLWDGFGGVNEVEIKWDGNKIVQTEPIRLTDGVMINKPIAMEAENKALFAIYTDKPTERIDSEDYPENGSFIFLANVSKDGKISLTHYSSFKVPDSINIHDEPQLVETGVKNNLLVFVRTTKGIYYARSYDYGKTWSSLSPFDLIGPTTSSRFFVGRLHSGNLMMIANNSTEREKMTVFLSRDGGMSWPYKLLLDGRSGVSYPDADQSKDGTVHIVFDRDRTGDKDILYCRITEDDVLKNNSKNIFKIRVNK